MISDNSGIDSKLYGMWRTTYNLNSTRGVITFKNNGQFEDSLINLAPETFDYVPKLVTSGNFVIENEFVRFSDVKMKYLNLKEIDSAETFTKYSDILSGYFIYGKYLLQPVIEFESNNQINEGLSGEWSTTRWICYYNKSNNPQFSSGKVKEIYNFNPETKTVRIVKKYLFNDSPADTDTTVSYSMKDRELQIGNLLKKWIVYFNNKMYWFNQNYYSYKKLNQDSD
ncbi:MAG TPA: hypothetical protein VKA26_05285 [Ignavibacteriaceae bacterium]|nr:hypothetical protein [Ignavibacteriaceae bacterium]